MKMKIEKYQNDNPKDGSLKLKKKKKDKFLLALIRKQRQKVVTEDQESR